MNERNVHGPIPGFSLSDLVTAMNTMQQNTEKAMETTQTVWL